MPLPLSVAIIAYNEADRLPATLTALRQLTGLADILVVDSYSTDATLSVAEAFGARVLQSPFEGFGPQKQFAIDHCAHPWVLLLDADEVLDAALCKAIVGLFKSGEPPLAGYHVQRSLVFLGRRFRSGKEARQRILRLIDRRRGRMTHQAVHEGLVSDGPTGVLPGTLWHYSYRGLDDYLLKFNRYTSLAAAELHAHGKQRNRLFTVLTLPLYFWKHYLLGGNWRNGYPGLIWSLLSAFYPVVKYWKVYALEKAATETLTPPPR